MLIEIPLDESRGYAQAFRALAGANLPIVDADFVEHLLEHVEDAISHCVRRHYEHRECSNPDCMQWFWPEFQDRVTFCPEPVCEKHETVMKARQVCPYCGSETKPGKKPN